jgi:hypothetical protein
MNVRQLLLKTTLIAALLLCFGPASGVRAESATNLPRVGSYKTATKLTIEPLKKFPIGEVPVLTVHLTTDAGLPVAKHLIMVFAYKNRATQGLTDASGTARIPLHFNFYPGSYGLLAAFSGSNQEGLESSSSTSMLTIVPGSLEVQTVPPMAGVQFILDGEARSTDADGSVQFSVDHIGSHHIQVATSVSTSDPNSKVSFDRWNDNDVSTYHEFKYPVHRTLQAGFLINYHVNLKYTDKQNQPVDPARVSLVRVRTVSDYHTLEDPSNAWLPTNRILHRVGGILESLPATYYLDSVNIGGGNVVNQDQQRFQLNRNSTWWIQLFLYNATFRAHDALFRTPLGTGILLEYPDGARQQLAFESSSSVIKLDSLPRGIYHASVQGTQGLEPRIPLSLSRGREFDLIVISRLDMAILFGVPAFIVLLMLLIGRTNLFVWLMPRRRRASQPSVS